MLMQKVLASKHSLLLVLIAEFCACVFTFLSAAVFDSCVVLDEKHCSCPGPGYNFQTENRSPCNFQETNQNLI